MKESDNKRIDRTCEIKTKGFKATMELAKKNRVKRYTNRQKQFEQKLLFTKNHSSSIFRNLLGASGETIPQKADEAAKVWSDLWAVPIQHDDGRACIKEC